MIFSLVYSSTASRPLEFDQLLDLLTESRSRNTTSGVTGVLLCQGDQFLQLLEGSEADVRRIYDLIRTDPRHHDVRTIWVSTGATRHFADWTMAFADLDVADIDHPAFSDLLSARKALDGDRAAVEDLLGVLEASL